MAAAVRGAHRGHLLSAHGGHPPSPRPGSAWWGAVRIGPSPRRSAAS